MYSIKCIAVGDPAVGKTALFWAYAMKDFPKHVPTIQDHSVYITWNDVVYNLGLFDVAGTTEDRLRPLAYLGSDVALVCFDANSDESLENAKSKWVPEVRTHCPGVPYLLVGTKTDLRDGDQGEGSNQCDVSGLVELAKMLGAVGYFECSALKREGIEVVIEKAVDAAITAKKPKQRRTNCIIL